MTYANSLPAKGGGWPNQPDGEPVGRAQSEKTMKREPENFLDRFVEFRSGSSTL